MSSVKYNYVYYRRLPRIGLPRAFLRLQEIEYSLMEINIGTRAKRDFLRATVGNVNRPFDYYSRGDEKKSARIYRHFIRAPPFLISGTSRWQGKYLLPLPKGSFFRGAFQRFFARPMSGLIRGGV